MVMLLTRDIYICAGYTNIPSQISNTQLEEYNQRGKRRKEKRETDLTLLMKPKGADARSKGGEERGQFWRIWRFRRPVKNGGMGTQAGFILLPEGEILIEVRSSVKTFWYMKKLRI